MAIFGRGPGGQGHGGSADGETGAARRGAQDRAFDRSECRLRPARDRRSRRQGAQLHRHRHQGRRGPRRRWPWLQDAGLREGLLPGLLPVRQRPPGTCGSTRRRSSGPVLSVVRAKSYDEALGLCNDHEYGNGTAIFTRDGDAARDFVSKVQVGMVGVNVPIPTPLAYYSFGGWKRSVFGDLKPARPRFGAVLHQDQDRYGPLALGRQGKAPSSPCRPCEAHGTA